ARPNGSPGCAAGGAGEPGPGVAPRRSRARWTAATWSAGRSAGAASMPASVRHPVPSRLWRGSPASHAVAGSISSCPARRRRSASAAVFALRERVAPTAAEVATTSASSTFPSWQRTRRAALRMRASRALGARESGPGARQDGGVRAWVVERPGPLDRGPLRSVTVPDPQPGPGEVRVRVSACGVCRTDLHLAEGDLQPRRPRTVPGHEVVGVVDAVGPGAERFAPGERIGIAWLRGTCGRCRWCRTGRENLCPSAVFTGWDADGGYAEYAVVPEAYAYRLPDALDDVTAAPLLCAGIVGYRALVRAEVPPGGRLGIYGFGASAHVV